MEAVGGVLIITIAILVFVKEKPARLLETEARNAYGITQIRRYTMFVGLLAFGIALVAKGMGWL